MVGSTRHASTPEETRPGRGLPRRLRLRLWLRARHVESQSYGRAEEALVEMVDIVRDRIYVLFNRDGDGEALGEAAAALVCAEATERFSLAPDA